MPLSQRTIYLKPSSNLLISLSLTIVSSVLFLAAVALMASNENIQVELMPSRSPTESPHAFVSKISAMRGILFDFIYILCLSAVYQHLNTQLKKIQHYYKVMSFDDEPMATKCAVDDFNAIVQTSQSKYLKSYQSIDQRLAQLYRSSKEDYEDNLKYCTLVR